MSLDECKRKRSNIKRNISRIKSIVEAIRDTEDQSSHAELQCRLGILESYFKQALSVQTDIEDLDPSDNGRADLEDNYIAVKLSIQEQLGEDGNVTVNYTETPSSSTIGTTSYLPKLSLPTFSGDYAEYKNFITSFTQIISRESKLSNIERFNYLLSCLKGSALETVKAFQVTSDNYPKALDRLKERFDNPTLIFLEGIASLFTLQPIDKSNAQQLRSLVDKASAIFSSLESLGTSSEIAQAMLIYIIMGKCDYQTCNKWNESLDYKSLPTWSKCVQVLERHCQFLHSSDSSMKRKSESSKHNRGTNHNQKSSFAVTNSSCVLCSSSKHKLIGCPQFKEMNSNQRFDTTKRYDLCINCLSNGHRMVQCPSKQRCRICNKGHHTMLHHYNSSQATSSTQQPTSMTQTSYSAPPVWQPANSTSRPQTYTEAHSSQAATHSHMGTSESGQVILATAIVFVKDATGSYKLGRALLDSCSQVNFITDDFAQKLRLGRERHLVDIRSIGNSLTNIKARATTTVKSRTSNFKLSLQFGITTHIAYQPDTEIDISTWKLPSNTTLADEEFFKPRRIDLLLGTEAFFEALAVGQIRLGTSLPTLQKTLFGWIVSGKYKQHRQADASACLMSCEDSIDENLQHLWKLEAVETLAKPVQPEHSICEDHFLATTYQDDTGRITVSLPFKDNPTCLGNSFEVARRRFNSIERRLLKSPDIRLQYNSFMAEYENLGHMSIVTNPNMDEPHFFIPHHCVFKPSSESTKLRVVFDASCKTTSQKSLNDLLLVGPTIQQELYILLLRFRLFRYAITADVTKMYRQVLLNNNDRKYHYILWRASPDLELRTYQLNTVTYGTASAPYLAVRSLHYLADKYIDEFPVGASVVKSSFYVDDMLCGADNIDALQTIKNQVIAVLNHGNFPLTKWHSNHPDFRECQTSKEFSFTEDSVTSALGVTWDQHNDMFLFAFLPKQIHTKITKRTILSTASSLFDPLGLLAPLLITSKIILQELWLLKLDWDESVSQNLQHAWKKYLSSLSSLTTLTVPRYCLQPNTCNLQIHGFCDASIRAYGCSLYLRTEDADGNISVHLLTSKSRVAPIKKQSLPKLELCGAHLLAQLYNKVRNIFSNEVTSAYFWTDSQLVLHWLQQHSVTLSTFVGNRVSDIQELTAKGQWRFVPTQQNPADLVSRGCTVTDLKTSNWFSGPSFLREDLAKWPVKGDKFEVDIEILNAEKRKNFFAVVVETNYILETIEKISTYIRCLRLVAWMFRFSDTSRKRSRSTVSSPTPQELRHALYSIVWIIQQQHFVDDFHLLRKNRPLKSSLKFLTPFLDNSTGFELIKVGGRLDNAELPDTQKYPILLPSNSQFVTKYVRHLHLKNYHAGPKALVALIRLQFWIVNARDVARRIVRSCVHCVRYKPKLLQQIMGPLPAARLTPARPFERCGVDFCGPINTYLRIRGKPPNKSYLAVFVCLLTKAVHIEVVSDLSTKAFLNALKRMGSRRKMPCDIFCDNATNFVGASNYLKELKQFLFNPKTQEEILKFCSSDFINFHFIPPRSPHFGGLWEAAIKNAKGLLYRTLANTKLTFEELSTVAAEIEAILNSRPLSPLSSDPNDFGALTAGHFLVGDSIRGIPERSVEHKNISSLDHFEMITSIKQRFWRRWSADYINELRTRVKWTTPAPNLTVGALVIIHDDNLPPLRWKLGRVESTVPGQDGYVRVVHLRTANGPCCRPIHKLAILPIS